MSEICENCNRNAASKQWHTCPYNEEIQKLEKWEDQFECDCCDECKSVCEIDAQQER